MSLFANGHGEDGRKFAIGLYRGAVLFLIAVLGYFLRDLHTDMKSTAAVTWDTRVKVDVMQRQLDVQWDETKRRFESLERPRFRSIRPPQ